MSFGLRKAAQTFQLFMDDTLRGLASLDDIPIFSRSLEEHEHHLRVLFNHLRSNGIIMKPTKCVFRASDVTFHGYRISAEGSRPLHTLVADLLVCPPPKTISQLRSFLGILIFYRRFLPHATAMQAPLHDILSGPRVKGSHPIFWTPEFLQAFAECKENLSRPTLLAHPDSSTPLALVTERYRCAIPLPHKKQKTTEVNLTEFDIERF
jgi:hypothetical protein